jgi:hypothetical protein
MKHFLMLLFFHNTVFSQITEDPLKNLFKSTNTYAQWSSKQSELNTGKNKNQSLLAPKLESNLYRTYPFYGDKEETVALGGSPLNYTDNFSLSLKHSLANSLTNTSTFSYTKNYYDEAFSTVSDVRKYELSHKLEYNITNGGSNSSVSIDLRKSQLQYNITELQSLKQLNDSYQDYLQKILNYLTLNCKISSYSSLKSNVDETLHKGKILLDIKAISKKDFLNYENLELDLEKSIADLKQQLNTTTNDLLTINIDALSQDLTLLKNKLCSYDKNLAEKTDTADRGKAVEIEIAQKQLDLSALDLKEAQRSLVTNVAPYLEVAYASEFNQKAKDYRVSAGVSFAWDLPTNRQSLQEKEKNYNRMFSAGEFNLAKKRMEQLYQTLTFDITYLTEMIEIQRKNLASNQDLIKILTLEKNLRTSDSLNFSSAASNRIKLIGSYFDLKSQKELKVSQLNLLNNSRYLIK